MANFSINNSIRMSVYGVHHNDDIINNNDKIDINTRISGYIVRHDEIIGYKKDTVKIQDLKNNFVNNKIDTTKFLKLCDYLVRGLRDRYSGDQNENGNKKLVLFSADDNKVGSINITIEGILSRLKEISSSFTEEDAKTLIALCTHRHATFSRVDSYPRTLKNMLKKLGINDNEKKLFDVIKRILCQVYYMICLKYSFKRNWLKADLSWTNLSNIDLFKANLSGTNLSYANLSGSNLINVYIKGANFKNTIFDEKTRIKLNFSGNVQDDFNGNNSILTAINSIDDQYETLKNDLKQQVVKYLNNNLSRINILNLFSINIIPKNLSGIKIFNLYIKGINFENTIFDEKTKITLKFSDNMLNDFNGENSILTAINSIDDQYETLKNDLMSQVFKYLQNKEISLIIAALKNIIFNSTFDYKRALINNQEFKNEFLSICFKGKKLLRGELNKKELLYYLDYKEKLKQNDFNEDIINNNGFIAICKNNKI